MADVYLIRGQFGAEVHIRVPEPGISERHFRLMVDDGQWTVLEGPMTEDELKAKMTRKPGRPKKDANA